MYAKSIFRINKKFKSIFIIEEMSSDDVVITLTIESGLNTLGFYRD